MKTMIGRERRNRAAACKLHRSYLAARTSPTLVQAATGVHCAEARQFLIQGRTRVARGVEQPSRQRLSRRHQFARRHGREMGGLRRDKARRVRSRFSVSSAMWRPMGVADVTMAKATSFVVVGFGLLLSPCEREIITRGGFICSAPGSPVDELMCAPIRERGVLATKRWRPEPFRGGTPG